MLCKVLYQSDSGETAEYTENEPLQHSTVRRQSLIERQRDHSAQHIEPTVVSDALSQPQQRKTEQLVYGADGYAEEPHGARRLHPLR